MKSNWKWYRLGDFCTKIGSGATPTGGKETYSNKGQFCLIRSQNVYNDGFSVNGLAFITEEQASKLNNVIIEKDDILLNITGDSVARVCLAPLRYLPARVNQHVAIIRPIKSVFDSRFVRYFLASSYQQKLMLGLAAAGATRNALTKSMIENFTVPCPPIYTQRYIADFLSSLDDRITLLRETNTTLESIAQTIFKSWFVDFDPVHAKAAGCQPEGIDAETAALFPDSFEESELGLVPKGWSVYKISDISEVIKGKSYSSKDLVEESSTALVTLKSFARGGGFRLDGFKPYAGNYKSSQIVVPGDLIIAYTDVTQAAELIGKPAIVVGVQEFTTMVASLDVGIIRPINMSVSIPFLYGLFNTPIFQAHTLSHTSGTTVLHLSKDAVGSFKFACPKPEIIYEFTKLAEIIVKRIQTNIDQIRTLSVLRDTLLPRLIFGQLQLPDELLKEDAK